MTRHVTNFDRRSIPVDMRLISSRTIPFVDSQSLAPGQAREALFRTDRDRFVLYLSHGKSSLAGEERVILLDLREALIWLNEPLEQHGSFWT
jgi:hypothetical protein